MKHLKKPIHILILGLIAILSCTNEHPIVEETPSINTPPVIESIHIPDTVPVKESTDLSIKVHDKDYDAIIIHWTLEIQTSQGTKIEEHKGIGISLISWWPDDDAHSATITVMIADAIHISNKPSIKSANYLGYPNNLKANEPIYIKREVRVREANTIIPGKSILNIKIGQNLNSLHNWTKMPRKSNGFIYNSSQGTIYGYTDTQNRITLLAIKGGSRLRTYGGNGTGSIGKSVQREFGKTNDIRYNHLGKTHVYKDKGISFSYKHSSIVRNVVIFDNEGFRQITTPIVPEDMSNVTIIK